jgi:hypothetical protein
MIDKPTPREVILAITLVLVGFVLLDQIDQRDSEITRISQQKFAAEVCLPLANNEIAVLAYRNGEIECALHKGKQGNRYIDTNRYVF